MKNVVYLTFNDQPGGIYYSQVIDVCRFYRDELNISISLVAFVSLRNFSSTKALIQAKWPDAHVLPMWPGVANWKRNAWMLKRKLKKIKAELVIARGPFATVLAQKCDGVKVCFDARGAYVPEFKEYDVSSGQLSESEVRSAEQQALMESESAIAVSEALVGYWKDEYGYKGNKHVIIPCTLSRHQHVDLTADHQYIKIVFAGGTGKWQSLHLIDHYLLNLFESNRNVHLTVLAKSLPENLQLKNRFPERVEQRWVREDEIVKELAKFDYGWLVREQTVTNKVASPVKFAEYLNSGLSVIISEQLGDFTSFVINQRCGIVVGDKPLQELKPISAEQKASNRALAQTYFTKEEFKDRYLHVVS